MIALLQPTPVPSQSGWQLHCGRTFPSSNWCSRRVVRMSSCRACTRRYCACSPRITRTCVWWTTGWKTSSSSKTANRAPRPPQPSAARPTSWSEVWGRGDIATLKLDSNRLFPVQLVYKFQTRIRTTWLCDWVNLFTASSGRLYLEDEEFVYASHGKSPSSIRSL